MNKKAILLIFIIILINIESRPKQQMVAPDCFEDIDCILPIPEGYCDIRYECYIGKCYHEFLRCPEICYGRIDEDYDEKIDCADRDCWNSIHCPCERANFNQCYIGRCYCPEGTLPHWIVIENNGHWCECR